MGLDNVLCIVERKLGRYFIVQQTIISFTSKWILDVLHSLIYKYMHAYRKVYTSAWRKKGNRFDSFTGSCMHVLSIAYHNKYIQSTQMANSWEIQRKNSREMRNSNEKFMRNSNEKFMRNSNENFMRNSNENCMRNDKLISVSCLTWIEFMSGVILSDCVILIFLEI